MSQTSTISLSLRVQGDGQDLPFSFAPVVNGSCPFVVQDVRIASATDTTVTVPTAPTGTVFKTMVVVGKQNSLVAKTLKGLAGDAGFALGADWAFAVLPMTANLANFVVTSLGGTYPEDLKIYYV